MNEIPCYGPSIQAIHTQIQMKLKVCRSLQYLYTVFESFTVTIYVCMYVSGDTVKVMEKIPLEWNVDGRIY